jgi:hypothetical protein
VTAVVGAGWVLKKNYEISKNTGIFQEPPHQNKFA